MKARVFFFVIGLWIGVWGLPAQNVKTVSSKAIEATVFFRGAELTHSATVLLERGTNEVRIEGLSAEIDVNSLKIKTSNNVLVSSFNFSIDYLSKSQAQSSKLLKNLEDSINICQAELDKLTISLKINAGLHKQLEAGITKSTSGSDKGLTLDELTKTMSYYKTESEKIEIQNLTLNAQKENAEKTLDRLKAQLEQESIQGKETSGILNLTLMASAGVNCALTINYYTPSAGWTPFSDISVTSADRLLTISQKAKVFQTTGLDWDKMKLTLSTATPSNGKVAPLFTTWFLSERVATPVLRRQAMMAQNAFSYAVKEEEEVVAAAPFYDEVANIKMDDFVSESDNALNITYTIDLPYSIPGNGKELNIDLQTKETTAEYKYYNVPKLDHATYVLAEISDWGQLGLLSGNANVTYEGVYIGATYIDAGSTHEKLTLTLGTDQRISVKREKLQDFSATRFMGNDVLQTFTYKITVRNNQNRKIKMVVKDQYPISTQRRIEVTLLKETTRWTANNEDVGVISWEEEFDAGEMKTYRISYSVKYPKDMKLNL